MAKKQKRKKKKRKSPFLKFCQIVFSILFVYFIVLLGIFAYSYLTYDPNTIKENPNFIDKIVEATKPTLPEYTNILVACTDEDEGRTDAIMLISYNSISKKINVVSIPRDTRVDIPDYQWEVMVKNFPVIKNDNPSLKKINAIPNYGKEQGMKFLEEYLEDLLGININYYVHFNLEGFRYIIDSVGGIEFDVPIKMRWPDPYIHLDPGLQLLDGEKAEQLLRFRKGYPNQDLGRVETQQKFVKVFIEKVTKLDTILSNPSAYLTTLVKYVDTNITISDVLKYLPEIKAFDSKNIQGFTLPNTIEKINGISFVEVDKSEALEFGYEIFKKPTVKEEDIVYEDSFDKSIIILNGSFTSGLASKTKELLESNGYIIGKIGDYEGDKNSQTIIYVENDGMGSDIKKFFTNAVIKVSPYKKEEYGYDIVIVLGKDETLNQNTQTNSTES